MVSVLWGQVSFNCRACATIGHHQARPSERKREPVPELFVCLTQQLVLKYSPSYEYP